MIKGIDNSLRQSLLHLSSQFEFLRRLIMQPSLPGTCSSLLPLFPEFWDDMCTTTLCEVRTFKVVSICFCWHCRCDACIAFLLCSFETQLHIYVLLHGPLKRWQSLFLQVCIFLVLILSTSSVYARRDYDSGVSERESSVL